MERERFFYSPNSTWNSNDLSWYERTLLGISKTSTGSISTLSSSSRSEKHSSIELSTCEFDETSPSEKISLGINKKSTDNSESTDKSQSPPNFVDNCCPSVKDLHGNLMSEKSKDILASQFLLDLKDLKENPNQLHNSEFSKGLRRCKKSTPDENNNKLSAVVNQNQAENYKVLSNGKLYKLKEKQTNTCIAPLKPQNVNLNQNQNLKPSVYGIFLKKLEFSNGNTTPNVNKIENNYLKSKNEQNFKANFKPLHSQMHYFAPRLAKSIFSNMTALKEKKLDKIDELLIKDNSYQKIKKNFVNMKPLIEKTLCSSNQNKCKKVLHQTTVKTILQVERKYNFLGVEEIDPNKYIEEHGSELLNNSKLPNLEITKWANSNNVLPRNFRLVSKKI